MMCGALQALEPKAEETVIDDVTRVRPVEKVALRKLGCGGADCGGGWKCIAGDEISAG